MVSSTAILWREQAVRKNVRERMAIHERCLDVRGRLLIIRRAFQGSISGQMVGNAHPTISFDFRFAIILSPHVIQSEGRPQGSPLQPRFFYVSAFCLLLSAYYFLSPHLPASLSPHQFFSIRFPSHACRSTLRSGSRPDPLFQCRLASW